ncbi:MAG: resolvase [Peptoniphilaceae bacterium]|nr:resolvase [Peptoniphilaceae bacterium]MDY6019082.1 resolvase [Anaerococcus sp.]
MSIYIYSKISEKIDIFEDIIELIKEKSHEIYLSIEHKRNFGELSRIKEEMKQDDILIIGKLSSLGINKAYILKELNYFISEKKYLVIANIESTYKYGLSQPMNQAVLKTLFDSISLTDTNIINLGSNKRSNAGRSKIEFPDNWDDLYEAWKKEEISSKEFMAKSGLKKATFYNMITEYRDILEANKRFIKKYKLA